MNIEFVLFGRYLSLHLPDLLSEAFLAQHVSLLYCLLRSLGYRDLSLKPIHVLLGHYFVVIFLCRSDQSLLQARR